MLQILKASPQIYDYLDFHEFLRQRYIELHKENRFFSYRYIGGKIGLDSGSVSRVLNKDRKITAETAARLAKVFGLNNSEKDFFETLVFYRQSKSSAEKEYFFEKILRQRNVRVKTLEGYQYKFYKNWYNLAIWSLLNFYPYDGEIKNLARMLTPAITPQQAEESLALLSAIGLIEKKDGKWSVTEKLISSGEEIHAVFVNNVHLEMARLSLSFLELFKTDERDFSGLTLTLSPASFKRIKEKLKQYRKEMMEIARQDDAANCVYRLNLQLFPLTRPFIGA